MVRRRGAAAVLGLLMLVGCAGGEALVPRAGKAEYLTRAQGWSLVRLPAEPFVLTAALAPQPAGRRLTVYLEGDGLAYLGATRVSPDPTPTDPVALRLALRHPGGAAAYLARPCQHVPAGLAQPACAPQFWTSHRYGVEVLSSLDRALDQLKQRTGAAELVLVGYSGGGALAVLLAAGRTDVRGLVTIAAPLDTRLWTDRHRLAPLAGSRNPVEVAAAVAQIPQLHLVGGRDEIVEPAISQAYLRALPPGHRASVAVRPNAEHGGGWVESWPDPDALAVLQSAP
jgi:pimeloyl-ACP methyl ester carboxylesterase